MLDLQNRDTSVSTIDFFVTSVDLLTSSRINLQPLNVFSFDKTMEAVVDAKNNLATKQEVENHLKRYLNVAKKLIDDTKLANDPTQDNFIKCKIYLHPLIFKLTPLGVQKKINWYISLQITKQVTDSNLKN